MDALIRKKLKLKTAKKFGEHVVKLRAAQKEPTHWGLDEVCPVVPLLKRLVPTDRALVVGKGAEGCACLLTAHDVDVVFWGSDLGVVERLEQRLATESLAARFFALMVTFGDWLRPAPIRSTWWWWILPPSPNSTVPRDSTRSARSSQQTNANGLHVLLP